LREKLHVAEVVDIDQIKLDPRFRIRESTDHAHTQALAESMRTRLGVLQPLLVDEDMHLLDGWTRYPGLKSAHIRNVLVVKRPVKSEQEGLRIALAANSFARQLNFLELGRVANHLLNGVREGSGRNRLRVEIAREIGKSEGYVAQAVATDRMLEPQARKAFLELCARELLGPHALMKIRRIPREQQLTLATQLRNLKNEGQVDQYVQAMLNMYEDNLTAIPPAEATQPNSQSSNSHSNGNHQDSEPEREKEKHTQPTVENYITLVSLNLEEWVVDKVDRWGLWLRNEKEKRRMNLFRELHAAKLKMKPGDLLTFNLRVEGPLRRDFRTEQREVILNELELMLQEGNGAPIKFMPKLLHDRLRERLREEQLPEAFEKAFSVTKIGNRLQELGLKAKLTGKGSVYSVNHMELRTAQKNVRKLGSSSPSVG
jgi:hypothetical protein